MENTEIVETRSIPVKDDQVLEVKMTQQFIDHLRKHFGLADDQPLDDDHVKMYVWGAVNTAVDKAERENNAKPPASTPRVRRTRRRKKDA